MKNREDLFNMNFIAMNAVEWYAICILSTENELICVILQRVCARMWRHAKQSENAHSVAFHLHCGQNNENASFTSKSNHVYFYASGHHA